MADLRFSNQGPIVLGLGGSYPSYASIPTVFGGPTQGILISVYNRGGAYVPNTTYNQSVPTTISAGNPVDFSDYYTTSNYVPSPSPVPPIPNPRPVNPDNPPDPTTVVVADVNLLTTGYINDTVNMGRLNTLNGAGLTPYTCSSVTINGITTPNIAVDPTNIQFVIQAEMNYDINNKANVLINIPSLQNGLNIANYFYRYPINYTVSGSISSTSGLAGDTITIDGLLSLQVDPYPTLTIGGIEQTISAISQTGNVGFLSFIVNADTPFTDSDIVITNNFGDSVTLSDQFKQLEVNPLPPSDRGPPPNIDWITSEILPEHLQFTFSNNYQVTASGYPILQAPTTDPSAGSLYNAPQAIYVTSDPDSDGYGNQSSVPFNADFQLVNVTSQPGFSSLPTNSGNSYMVKVGTLVSDINIPANTSSNFRTYNISFIADNNRSFAGVANVTPGGSNLTQINFTSYGSFFASQTNIQMTISSITFANGVNSTTLSISLANSSSSQQTFVTAGTEIWLGLGQPLVSSSITTTNYQNGTSETYSSSTQYFNTYKGYPIFPSQVQISEPGLTYYRVKLLNNVITTQEPTTGDLCGVAVGSAYITAPGTSGSSYGNTMIVRFSDSNLLSTALCNVGVTSLVSGTGLIFPSTSIPVTMLGSTTSSATSMSQRVPWAASSPYLYNSYLFKCIVGGKLFANLNGIIFNFTDNVRLVSQSTSLSNLSYVSFTAGSSALTNKSLGGKFYNWNGKIAFLALGSTPAAQTASNLGSGGWFELDGSSTGIDRRQTSPYIVFSNTVVKGWGSIYDDILVSSIRSSSFTNYSGAYMLNNSWNVVIPPNWRSLIGTSSVYNFTRINNGFTAVSFKSSTSQYTLYKTGPLLDPTSPDSYTFTRPASATYTAINLTINPLPGTTNMQKATSLFNSILAVWNKTPNPTATYTTDASGNLTLDINTNQNVMSNSTFTLTTGTPTGTLTFNSFGGTTGDINTRLSVGGAQNNIWIDSDYGYVYNGSSYLTFTHGADSFDANSAVIQDNYIPSSIRDLILY